MNRTLRLAGTTLAALTAFGCGSTGIESTGSIPAEETATPAPEQAPTAVPYPNGIYVAPFDGSDSAPGSVAAPKRSVNAAISAALAQGLHDVFVYGGGLNAAVTEVVVLADGVNLHGSVCIGEEGFRQSTESCRTVLSGGSPALVANGIHATTTVKDLTIEGSEAPQTGPSTDKQAFLVRGIGCVGYGVLTGDRAPTVCPAPTDLLGRAMPKPSLGVAVAESQNLFFQNVQIESRQAGNGIVYPIAAAPGADGLDALPSSNAVSATNAGNGAIPSATQNCGDAQGSNRGGMGGEGGAFGGGNRNGQTGIVADWNTAAPGSAGIFDPVNTRGGNGGNGKIGLSGANGLDGIPGTANELDSTYLVGRFGTAGAWGRNGQGGGAGGGGAAAVRHKIKKSSGSTGFKVVGSIGWDFDSQTETSNAVGATSGGAGGNGGYGGCGGEGGRGGQGGASSVAVYAHNSTVTIVGSLVKAGNGGNGANGTDGANGGLGGDGRDGSLGTAVTQLASGSSGDWGVEITLPGGTKVSNPFTFGMSSGSSNTLYLGWSMGGKGGRGGNGGLGGRGGAGAGGAGGASIATLTSGVGDVTAVESTIELGLGGVGGGIGALKGADGFVANAKILY